MAPSTDILIGDVDGQHILIRPLSRTHPGLFDYRDGNWIDCDVHVVAGGFRGAFPVALRSDEFRTFHEELEGPSRNVEGTGSFMTLDGQLAVSVAADGEGRAWVAGHAIDMPETGNRLQFGFEIDRASLPEISRSLKHLLDAFPVIGTPET